VKRPASTAARPALLAPTQALPLRVAGYVDAMRDEVLRPFQRAFIDAALSNRRVGLLGARQVGKSLALGVLAVVLGCGHPRVRAADVMMVSKDQKTSANLIRYVRQHLEALGEFAGESTIIDPKLGSTTRIALANGRYIFGMPGTTASLQGFTGHVIIDELSATGDDPEDAFDQASAVGSSQPDLRLVVCSNADYEGSFVHGLFASNDTAHRARWSAWSLATVTIEDVWGVDLPTHLVELREQMRPSSWERWYLCGFPGVEGSAFDRDVVRRCAGVQVAPRGTRVRVLSIDVGHVVNPSGVVIADVWQGALQVVRLGMWFGRDVDWQEAEIVRLVELEGVQQLIVDAGAIGYELNRRLVGRYGARVSSANVVSARANGSGVIDQLMRGGRVGLPECEELGELVADLTAMKRAADGDLVVPTRPARDRRYKIHCDLGEALIYLGTHPHLHRPMTDGTTRGASGNQTSVRHWTRLRGAPSRLH